MSSLSPLSISPQQYLCQVFLSLSNFGQGREGGRLSLTGEYMTKLIDSTFITAQAGNQSSFLSFCKMSLSVVRKRELDNTCLLYMPQRFAWLKINEYANPLDYNVVNEANRNPF